MVHTIPTAYADPGDGLATVVALRELADQIEADEVLHAVNAGWSWSRIAEALGVSRQAVHKKYAKRLGATGAIRKGRR